MIVAPLAGPDAQSAAAKVDLPAAFADLKVFQILLKHPVVAKSLAGTLITLLNENKLDARLRELIIMRIGWVTGAVYEWTQHYRVSRQIGLNDEEIIAVRDWSAATSLTAADKAVLQATDDVLEVGHVREKSWAGCAEFLSSEEERIELVVAIGNWVMFSQLLRSLSVPLEEGVVAWPPDGKSPDIKAPDIKAPESFANP
jgi:alkylhydroperoxidase family enzyme